MRDDYDRSSKWILQHHGNAVLMLGGVRDIRSWRPLQADVVQPRQLPDGLLEAACGDEGTADLYVVEIATYPEDRVAEQALRDAIMVFLDRRRLPEVLTLVLRPRGRKRVQGSSKETSARAWSRLRFRWKVVELWTLPAERLLRAKDIGLIPWVPLSRFDGPAKPIIQECRARIDDCAPAEQRANLLAVTQVLTRLRYNDAGLLSILGGTQAMIDSPLIRELTSKAKEEGIQAGIVKARKQDVIRVLSARFGPLPAAISARIEKVPAGVDLEELIDWAARCTDLNAFRTRL
ncbi:hypothetical protein AYO40_00065 [Planctomycetaceae bacterium SCGC AG-212-D15]|nr:hypothetical protein AYO40_00065 [Planctomycetaceae bacterium SCGC AG-212-D15]